MHSLQQTLRKRYRALKEQADQEEVRIRIEEERREVQSELDKQKLEMQAELDRKKLEMEAEFEAKKRAMQANLNGGNGQVESAAPTPAAAPAAAAPAASSDEGVLALSQVTCLFDFGLAGRVLSEPYLGRKPCF